MGPSLVAVGLALAFVATLVAFPDLIARLAPVFLYHPGPLSPERGDPGAWGLEAAEEVRIRAEDGTRLHAWWVPAASGPARGAAVFFHGNAGHLAHRAPIAADLAALGLDVLLFDWRGYGLSEGRPSEAGLRLDARAAWLHVREARGVDPSRILLVGNSLGGSVAAAMAPDLTAAGLVTTGGFRSVPHMAKRIYPLLPDRLLAWETNRFDAAAGIARARMPVLVACASLDEVVPCAETRALFEAAREPKRWVEIRGARHNDLWNHPVLWREVGRFVDETLGPPRPGGP